MQKGSGKVSEVVLGLFIVTGCGSDFPTDDEMIHHFLLHEPAFNELRDIITQRSGGTYYPPYDADTLYGYDSASVAGLSSEDRVRLDSLLKEIDCGRVFYWDRLSVDGEESDTSGNALSIPYSVQRFLTSETYKEYLYHPEWNEELMPLTDQSSELNYSYGSRDTVIYKSIKDDWYISLVHSP